MGNQCLWISRSALTYKIIFPPTWYKNMNFLKSIRIEQATQIPFPSHSKIFVIHKHWAQGFIMILLQDTTKYRHHFSTSSVAHGWPLPRETVLGLSRFCLYSAVVLLLCKKKKGLLYSTTNQASQLKLHYCCKPSVIYVGLLSGILVENTACILPFQTNILIHECCKK